MATKFNQAMETFFTSIKRRGKLSSSAVWKNAHLWYIVLITAACSAFYYLDSIFNTLGWPIPQWNILYTPHDFHRLLFAIPILYASYIFRTRGAIITTLISALIFLPRSLFISLYLDPLPLSLFFCGIVGTIAVLEAKLLDEITARNKAERTQENCQALLQEVHHRVRNNLQIVSSLLDMSKLRAISNKQLICLQTSAPGFTPYPSSTHSYTKTKISLKLKWGFMSGS